jgi:uncharacterized protein (DUF1697 family)
MTKYVAFLRGVSPQNPNMRNEKLRELFESLGFQKVQTVLASGNVLFESSANDANELETEIETALFETLGSKSAVIIRSWEQLSRLTGSDPFNGQEDTPTSRLNVTFIKGGGEVYSVIDLSSTTTPDVMRHLEKEHGKDITTRTWKTITRILEKLGEA